MKLYIAPKLKELHRRLISNQYYREASLVYRYMLSGNPKWISYPSDVLKSYAQELGLHILKPSFTGTYFQR